MTLPAPGEFVLATGNESKAREITEVLTVALNEQLVARPIYVDGALVGFLMHGAGEDREMLKLTAAPDVTETGETLVENARIKATALAAATGLPTIADDTGLSVDALDGAPGVRSARYAGESATAHENTARLLAVLGDLPLSARSARFETVIVTLWPDGREAIVSGQVPGWIALEPRGDGGFGYDPVFVPEEADGRTFGQMTPSEKHALSHRGRAVRALAGALRDA